MDQIGCGWLWLFISLYRYKQEQARNEERRKDW